MLAAQSQSYGQTAAVGGVPREIGILARADGIAASLYELQQKLEGFGHKLAGSTDAKGANGTPQGSGIGGALSAAETRLRECHQLVDILHQAF